MIREKHLVPGRVLVRLHAHPTKRNQFNDPAAMWVPCMVICYLPEIDRRHAKKSAPVKGWQVLVMWMDDRSKRLDQIYIATDHYGWKIAGW